MMYRQLIYLINCNCSASDFGQVSEGTGGGEQKKANTFERICKFYHYLVMYLVRWSSVGFISAYLRQSVCGNWVIRHMRVSI